MRIIIKVSLLFTVASAVAAPVLIKMQDAHSQADPGHNAPGVSQVTSSTGALTGNGLLAAYQPTYLVSASQPSAEASVISAAITATNERVPRDADSSNQAGWWNPIDSDGTTTYVAFNSVPSAALGQQPDPTVHEVKIGKKAADGTWTFGVLKNLDGTTWRAVDDVGHHQPTIAVDGQGYIHVWADMHNESENFAGRASYGWRYWRSDAPHSLNFTRRADMPGDGRFTYPVAKRGSNGDVWLIIRNRQLTNGTGELYKWGTNTGHSPIWTKVADFALQNDAVVYPDDIAFGTDGSVHVLWEWAKSITRSLRHYGSYLRYQPSSNQWFYVDGSIATVPVGLTNQKLFYLPLQSGEAFTTDEAAPGLQSAKFALDSNNRPTIAFRFRPTANSGTRDFDVSRVRWDGFNWVNRETIYMANNDTFAGLGITRTSDRVRVYFATQQDGLRLASRSATSASWQLTNLAPSRAIERLGVVPISSTTDLIYGAAPTDLSSTSGSVYLVRATE